LVPAVDACCPDTTPIVRDIDPGTYYVAGPNPRVTVGDDTNYQIVIDSSKTHAVETFVRSGQLYRHEYALGPGTTVAAAGAPSATSN
jgi:hypothetical protein